MASIEKRGDSFRIKIFLGNSPSGKKRFRTTTFIPVSKSEKKALKEVQAFAARFEDQVKRGEVFDERITVEKYYREHWLPDFGYKLTAHEKQETERTIERVWLPEIGHLKINEVRAYHIQAVINSLEKSGKKPRTIAKYVSQARPVFSTAFKLEIIANNPFDRVSIPKIEKTDATAFTIEQTRLFLDLCKNGITVIHPAKIGKNGKHYGERVETVGGSMQFYCLFLIMIYGGLRRGEVLSLVWKDIDFARQAITVDKAVSSAKSAGGRYIKSPKTKAGYRTIDLPKTVFDYLLLWKREQMDICENIGSVWAGKSLEHFDEQVLFIQVDGKPMDINTPNRKMHNIITLYNSTVPEEEWLPLLHCHSLRHTCASQLVQAGIDIATIAKRLGHSDLRVLLNVYTHSTEKELDRQASNTLEKVFSAPSENHQDGELLGNYGELN